MSGLALALVLAAAVLHATWNLLAKRAGGAGSGAVAFVWLVGTISTLLLAPLVVGVFVLQRPRLGPVELAFIAGSAIIHLAYFLLLQRAYRAGDLSLIYPLARGTGPALSTAAAILLLGERPTPLALLGAALIVASVVVLAASAGGGGGGPTPAATRAAGAHPAARAVAFGIATGVLIAAYTVWDKHAVATLAISPILLEWCSQVARVVLLAPAAARRREAVRALWRLHRREILGVAIMGPLGYLFVLAALAFTPVSYVAPAREVSILIGAAMGHRLLGEGHAPRRLAAAAAMVAGLVALAVG